MATTLKNATLKVTIKEEITLNGSRQDAENILRVSDINEIYKRVVTCPASNTTTIATFSANTYDSVQAIDVNDAKYIRITNLDSSNSIELAVVGPATLYQVTVAAGQSHILGSPDDLMLAEADTSPSFGTMADVASIQVNPASNTVDVELFIASA
tara:strand:- start:1085 stop:1549 length:465 start_codon:yes stop_codon:yes gene_type:complete